MNSLKHHIPKIVLAVFILIAGLTYVVQKLMNKEYQHAEKFNYESKKNTADAVKQTVTLRTAYSAADEMKTMNDQSSTEMSSQKDKNPSQPSEIIYEKPSNDLYLAQ